MEILNKVFKCNKETFQIDKFKELHTAPNNHAPLKGTVMQIEKALINDHLHVSKVSWKFCIATICKCAVV